MSVRPVPAASIYVSMVLEVSVDSGQVVRKAMLNVPLNLFVILVKVRFASPRLLERYCLYWFSHQLPRVCQHLMLDPVPLQNAQAWLL